MDGQTDGRIGRYTYKPMDRLTGRRKDVWTEHNRQTFGQTDGQTDGQTGGQTDIHTDQWTDRHEERMVRLNIKIQMDRWTDTPTERWKYRQKNR